MFKIGMPWIKKSTEKKEDVKKLDAFHVYSWNMETNNVTLIDKFATEELALASATYLANYYKNIVVMNQDGKVIKML